MCSTCAWCKGAGRAPLHQHDCNFQFKYGRKGHWPMPLHPNLNISLPFPLDTKAHSQYRGAQSCDPICIQFSSQNSTLHAWPICWPWFDLADASAKASFSHALVPELFFLPINKAPFPSFSFLSSPCSNLPFSPYHRHFLPCLFQSSLASPSQAQLLGSQVLE